MNKNSKLYQPIIDWDNPTARARLIDILGVERYNAAIETHKKLSSISTINGHRIRPIATRFGRLYMVEGTERAFNTLPQAEAFARQA